MGFSQTESNLKAKGADHMENMDAAHWYVRTSLKSRTINAKLPLYHEHYIICRFKWVRL